MFVVAPRKVTQNLTLKSLCLTLKFLWKNRKISQRTLDLTDELSLMGSINKSISWKWLDSGRMIAGHAISVLHNAGSGEVTVHELKSGINPFLAGE